MIYDAGIHLAEGTVLLSCKIVHPCGDALLVDLQVCHSGPVRQPNGELACRAGVRILQQPAGLAKRIGIFVVDLDRSE